MTPFGERVRALRRKRGVTMRAMAAALHLSAPYLSALEHGRRGRPTDGLVHQVCGYFGLFWDDAEELRRLARLSHPRITVDTAGLSPAKTELANLLAERIRTLPEPAVKEALKLLQPPGRRKRG